MLTRLKVKGFKNLLDVDVRFGPFTCIAGVNGVGKSNLFDAIRFLSLLADKPLLEAALSIRNDEGENYSSIRTLFHRTGDSYDTQMSFEAELIIPPTGVDDFGQEANASITIVRYELALSLQNDSRQSGESALRLEKEELSHLNIGDAKKHLLFDFNAEWRKSVISGRRTSKFISTDENQGMKKIKLHQDGSAGLARQLSASNLQRTVLSGVNAAENPTALLVRREMQSWRMLQLEPTALRKPDRFTSPSFLYSDGAHLAATLFRLAKAEAGNTPLHGDIRDSKTNKAYCQIANRLSSLIREAQGIWIERDDKRELLTLNLLDSNSTSYPAHALSDGTLRFLALATLDIDPLAQGLLCLEEPENGIHPDRVSAMIRLLQDIACDTTFPLGNDNPLRQVIINTHSPAVVQQIPDDALLMAEASEGKLHGKRTKRVTFRPLDHTWRTDRDSGILSVSKNELLAYLNPLADPPKQNQADLNLRKQEQQIRQHGRVLKKRVVDREDLQPYLFPQTEVQS